MTLAHSPDGADLHEERSPDSGNLRVSVNTVGFHIRNIYDKLQVHSKSEAVAKALRMGLAR